LASDISAEAIALAQTNVDKFALPDRVSLFCGDLFAPVQNLGYEGKVSIVICNPPYIPTGSLDKLAPEIIDHEPVVALDAGQYGINIYRRLVTDALLFLKPGGTLTFEIGAGQEKIAMRLLQKTGGYERITPVVDKNGVIRVITAVTHEKV
jgi:release factor glutamine methyltransferase